MWDQKPSFRFEIDNFSDKEAVIASKDFVAGGCEWYLAVDPKGDYADHLSLFLYVANRNSLRTGWKRSAKYYFIVLNESDKELYRSSILGTASNLFCAEDPAWGKRKTLPLSKFQKKGFLENDKLIIEVYINVVEAFDGEGGDINNGFEGVSSFDESLVQQLEERMKNLELMVSGFKKDCLKSNLEMSSKRIKKSNADDECRFQKLGKSVMILELMMHQLDWKLDGLKSEHEEEKKNADESLVQELVERIKNLEVMDIGFKLDCVNTKLDNNADESRVQQLEERVKDLEVMKLGVKLDCLNTKIEEESLERKKSDDARFQHLEESVKDIRLMMSCLTVDDDGFLLVD